MRPVNIAKAILVSGLTLVAGCERELPGDPSPIGAPLQIVAGSGFSCSLSEGGRTSCWGANDVGQLGRGTTSAGGSPGIPQAEQRFEQIAAGDRNVCALAQGRAYCWGAGVVLGRKGHLLVPTPVESGSIRFTAISVGGFHACGITPERRAYCWGGDSLLGAGALGNGTGQPSQSAEAVAGDIPFDQVSAGFLHTCARSGGRVWCWGSNFQNALGLEGITAVTKPTEVLLPIQATRVAAGAGLSCAEDGNVVYCWGINLTGQLGRLPVGGSDPIPGRVGTGVTMAQIALSPVNRLGTHSCALDPDGVAICWGANDHGQLGRETVESCPVGPATMSCGPTPGPPDSSQRFVQIAPGADHTCGIAERVIICWGANDRGQLGSGGPTAAQATPDPIGKVSLKAAGTRPPTDPRRPAPPRPPSQ
jgi:serine/threonine-protein kinase